jgi:hypothetical protein
MNQNEDTTMNPHDEFTRDIVKALNQIAQQHPHQVDIARQVELAMLQPQRKFHSRKWAFGGLALAAALTGFTVAPHLIQIWHQDQVNQATAPKLSPQMMDDMEMLSLLGTTENRNYGS